MYIYMYIYFFIYLTLFCLSFMFKCGQEVPYHTLANRQFAKNIHAKATVFDCYHSYHYIFSVPPQF